MSNKTYKIICFNETKQNEEYLFNIISCADEKRTFSDLTISEVLDIIEENKNDSFSFVTSSEILRYVLIYKINEEYYNEDLPHLALLPRCSNFSYSELEEAAYMITVKRQILSFFEEDNYVSDEFLAKITNHPTPLDFLYKKWMDNDSGIHTPVYNFLENVI